MRVVIAGGGTGGHTSPGLAVAARLREIGAEVHWIGSRRGIEARRVPEAGVPFYTIPVGNLRRYWDWQNVPDLAVRAPAGLARSWRLLRRLNPRLVFATGGFVALPPALAARALHIPGVVRGPTAVPGLANRIARRFARRIALTFSSSCRDVRPDRVVLTGNPLRPELAGGSREAGCRLFGFNPAEAVVYVTGGSQGSHKINRTIGAILPTLLEQAQVVHQCGDQPTTGDWAWLEGVAAKLPERLRARYALRPYVGAELRDLFAAADLVIGRSGAGTVNECCQLGRAALYIPLPGTSGDEQTANARLVEAAEGGVLLPQVSLTSESLLEVVRRLLSDRPALARMGERARTLAVPDAAERLAQVILDAAKA